MRITAGQLRRIIREEIIRESETGQSAEPAADSTQIQGGAASSLKPLMGLLGMDDSKLSLLVTALKAGEKRSAAHNAILATAFEKLVELDPAQTTSAASLLKKIKTDDN